jgi:hypothetical protein
MEQRPPQSIELQLRPITADYRRPDTVSAEPAEPERRFAV